WNGARPSSGAASQKPDRLPDRPGTAGGYFASCARGRAHSGARFKTVSRPTGLYPAEAHLKSWTDSSGSKPQTTRAVLLRPLPGLKQLQQFLFAMIPRNDGASG